MSINALDAGLHFLATVAARRPMAPPPLPPPARGPADRRIYYAERIVGHRDTTGGRLYEVKWVGYATTTFEPLSHFYGDTCIRAVADYDAKLAMAAPKKLRRAVKAKERREREAAAAKRKRAADQKRKQQQKDARAGRVRRKRERVEARRAEAEVAAFVARFAPEPEPEHQSGGAARPEERARGQRWK